MQRKSLPVRGTRHEVWLRIYDLSNGNFALPEPLHGLSLSLVKKLTEYGIQECMWGGIDCMLPCQVETSFSMQIVEAQLLGYTARSRPEFERFLSVLKNKFTPHTYDLIRWNCNHFSDLCSRFLLNERGIPEDILDLPDIIRSTFMGDLVIKFVKRLYQNRNPVFSIDHPDHPRFTLEQDNRRLSEARSHCTIDSAGSSNSDEQRTRQFRHAGERGRSLLGENSTSRTRQRRNSAQPTGSRSLETVCAHKIPQLASIPRVSAVCGKLVHVPLDSAGCSTSRRRTTSSNTSLGHQNRCMNPSAINPTDTHNQRKCSLVENKPAWLSPAVKPTRQPFSPSIALKCPMFPVMGATKPIKRQSFPHLPVQRPSVQSKEALDDSTPSKQNRNLVQQDLQRLPPATFTSPVFNNSLECSRCEQDIKLSTPSLVPFSHSRQAPMSPIPSRDWSPQRGDATRYLIPKKRKFFPSRRSQASCFELLGKPFTDTSVEREIGFYQQQSSYPSSEDARHSSTELICRDRRDHSNGKFRPICIMPQENHQSSMTESTSRCCDPSIKQSSASLFRMDHPVIDSCHRMASPSVQPKTYLPSRSNNKLSKIRCPKPQPPHAASVSEVLPSSKFFKNNTSEKLKTSISNRKGPIPSPATTTKSSTHDPLSFNTFFHSCRTNFHKGLLDGFSKQSQPASKNVSCPGCRAIATPESLMCQECGFDFISFCTKPFLM